MEQRNELDHSGHALVLDRTHEHRREPVMETAVVEQQGRRCEWMVRGHLPSAVQSANRHEVLHRARNPDVRWRLEELSAPRRRSQQRGASQQGIGRVAGRHRGRREVRQLLEPSLAVQPDDDAVPRAASATRSLHGRRLGDLVPEQRERPRVRVRPRLLVETTVDDDGDIRDRDAALSHVRRDQNLHELVGQGGLALLWRLLAVQAVDVGSKRHGLQDVLQLELDLLHVVFARDKDQDVSLQELLPRDLSGGNGVELADVVTVVHLAHEHRRAGLRNDGVHRALRQGFVPGDPAVPAPRVDVSCGAHKHHALLE